MSPQPALPPTEDAPAPHAIAPEDLEHLRHTLVDIVGLGIACARAFVAEAAADPLPGPYDREIPIPHPTEFIALCFEKTARAIRRSAELACTLGQQPGQVPEAHLVIHLRRTLIETVDLGAQLTRIVVGQLTAPPIPHPVWGDKAPMPHPAAHVANCYDRLARAIRHAADLAVSIGQPRPTPAKPRLVVSNDTPEPIEPRERATTGQPHRDAPSRDKPDWRDPPEDFSADHARPPTTSSTNSSAASTPPPPKPASPWSQKKNPSPLSRPSRERAGVRVRKQAPPTTRTNPPHPKTGPAPENTAHRHNSPRGLRRPNAAKTTSYIVVGLDPTIHAAPQAPASGPRALSSAKPRQAEWRRYTGQART